MRNINKQWPYAYFITFTTYGSWLHGDKRNSVDPQHNTLTSPRINPNSNLFNKMRLNQNHSNIILNPQQRNETVNEIQKTCKHYDWCLFAVHVRSSHVHMIVQAACAPEKVLTQIKAYTTRALNKLTRQHSQQKYWSRHGSTRYIWSSTFLFPVMEYVMDQQGEKMACFHENWYEKKEV